MATSLSVPDDVRETSSSTGSITTTATARLTPDFDSDQSDDDVEDFGVYNGESYQMHDTHLDHGSGQAPFHDEEKTEDLKHPDSFLASPNLERDDASSSYGYHGSAFRGRDRGSFSTVQSFQLYTPDEERAVVRKFDRKLVVFVAFLYMLSFLDRSNIGNAKIAGLARDLALDSNQYEWLLGSFYFSYIAFEWMSVLWKVIPAHIFLTLIVLSWGIIASMQSCASSFSSLLLLRILLGIGEAAFAGIPFYLSFFFKREELALRTGFFISAAPLATSFASTLAWVIIKLGERGPIAAWRLLFLLEGFPSILIAVVVWHVIPDGPARAKFLTKREKKVARLRLRREKPKVAAQQGKGDGLKWREMLQAITDPKSYLTAIMFFFSNMAFSSMPVFLPTIIHMMGHSALVSQALAAPPFLVSFVAVILTAYYSDRLQNRSYFVCFHALLSAAGYAFLAVSGQAGWSEWLRYAAIFPAAVGFFSVVTIIITWTINNQDSESKQGAGFALLQIIGQCGPFVGTRLYPDEDAPAFTRGMTACAGAMVMVAILSMCLRFYLKRLNARHEVQYQPVDDGADEGLVSKRPIDQNEVFQFFL